jgi:FdhD protein
LYGLTGNRLQKTISVTMRTPGNDDELSAGFLFTEGILRHHHAIEKLQHSAEDKNRIVVSLNPQTVPQLQYTERNFYTTAACGVCGKTDVDHIYTISSFTQPGSTPTLHTAFFRGLQQSLRQQQEFFDKTGGLHAAALFNTAGELMMVREDVGRHNALDKLIGAAYLQQQLPLTDAVLLLSGRAGFELVQKAAMAGVCIIAAVGAPSSLAVQLAVDSNITLLGFLRDDRFNIYSGAQRIIHS